MTSQLPKKLFGLFFFLAPYTSWSQGPFLWIFGKDAALDFSVSPPQATTYNIDNCYGATSVQCDAAGNLLFYGDGRNVMDRSGAIMASSENVVLPSSVAIYKEIVTNIVPLQDNPEKYLLLTLTPSFGNAPFGAYGSGALTCTEIDMSLNAGMGGIGSYRNILIDTGLSIDLIVVPGYDCSYWALGYQKRGAHGRFAAYHIIGEQIIDTVYSDIMIGDNAFQDIKMIYSYRNKKIVAAIDNSGVATFDFNDRTGNINNPQLLFRPWEFGLSNEYGVCPSICLSPDEQLLYVLGYVNDGGNPENIGLKLMQFQIKLNTNSSSATSSMTIFESHDGLYCLSHTPLPYYYQECSMRCGPDKRIYIQYQTGLSFLGVVQSPDLVGSYCNFQSQGLTLLSRTYGSYYFPSIENYRLQSDTILSTHDTSICFTKPISIEPVLDSTMFYSYEWDNGTTERTRFIQAPGTYWVKSSGSCNMPMHIDSFFVRDAPVEQCSCTLLLPSAFTPNGDNLNDIFLPVIPLNCIKGNYQLVVFDRWGRSVFISYNVLSGWDGTINGGAADIGVYFYHVSYQNVSDETIHHRGDITLIR